MEGDANGSQQGAVSAKVNLWEQRASSSGTGSASYTAHTQPKSSTSTTIASSSTQMADMRRTNTPKTEMLGVMFHLYVGHDAEKASILLEKPIPGCPDVTIELEHVAGNKKYWKSEYVTVPLDECDSVHYKYIVKYSQWVIVKVARFIAGSDNKREEIHYRKLYRRHEQFDIFKNPDKKGELETIFEGQLFFMKTLYEQIERLQYNGKDFKRLMIKCEHVGLISLHYTQKCKEAFRKFVEEAVSSGMSSRKSAFICSVLGQFVTSAKTFIRITDLFKPGIIDKLLDGLQHCDQAILPDSSLLFIRGIAIGLLNASSLRSNLHYIACFCHLFDKKEVLKTAGSFGALKDESQFEVMVDKIVWQLQRQSKEKEDVRELAKFVINQVPNIDSLWTLYRKFQMSFSQLTSGSEDLFVNSFKTFFTWPRKTNLLLNIKIWRDVPQGMKPSLAEYYSEQLLSQMKAAAFKQEHDVMESAKSYALDKEFNSFALKGLYRIQEWLIGWRTTAALELFDDPRIEEVWRKLKKEEKEGIIVTLFQTLSEDKKVGEKLLNKEKVVSIFSAMEQVSQVKLWEYEAPLSALYKAACTAAEKHGLRAIVDAHEKIHSSLGPLAKQWYMKCLESKMGVEQAKGDMLTSLREIIREEGRQGQDVQIDGGREEILLIILNQTKLPPCETTASENDVKQILQAILEEHDTWKLALEVTGSVNRLQKDPKFTRVKETLSWVANATIEGNLTLWFFKDIDRCILANLFSICKLTASLATSEEDVSPADQWRNVLDSFKSMSSKLRKTILKTKKVLDFVKESCKEQPVHIIDYRDVSSQLDEMKKRFKQVKQQEVTEGTFWGSLGQLIEPVENLFQYFNCKLFVNCSSICLKTLGTCSVTVADVMTTLNDHAITYFKQMTEMLLNSSGEITILEMDNLIHGITQERLQKELEEIRKCTGRDNIPSHLETMIQNCLTFPNLRDKIEQLLKLFLNVGFDESTDDPLIAALGSFVNIQGPSTTMASLSKTLEQEVIQRMNKEISDDLADVIRELADSEGLIQFIIKTANDNMVDLIDAVEEHSDQLIQETTVSYLIDIHRFLSGLLKSKSPSADTFFRNLVDTYQEITQSSKKKDGDVKTTTMATKINICSNNVHSLRGLYMNLAENRGEMTKAIITSALNYGCYQVKTSSSGPCEVLLTYDRKDERGSEARYEMSDLHDLRSRALLIVNSDKPQSVEVEENERIVVSKEELRNFIEQVDLVTEIAKTFAEIREAGRQTRHEHCWIKLNSSQQLREKELELKTELKSWKGTLERVRKMYFYLNYFHANQIWLLLKFLKFPGKITEEEHRDVLSMFRAIDPRIDWDEMQAFVQMYEPPKKREDESELEAVGVTLNRIFIAKHQAEPEQIIDCASHRDVTVEAGRLFVAVLELKSEQTVHVLMSLFKNTTGRPPGPSQVLFCHPETSWGEIELFLQRTFEAHYHEIPSRLHCLANVESLPNDLQFELVDVIKASQESIAAPYRLAIICRGGGHHHIVDQFAEYVHHLGGMSDSEMRMVFAETCPDVFLVVSDLPGQGKSELICDDASQKQKSVINFPISGPVSRPKIAKAFSSLMLKKFNALHITVGEVDDPLALDTLLFELIVTGMISSGTLLFHLPTKHVYVEVANTLEHWLRDSLPVLKNFKRIGATWEGYENCVITNEVTSPVQVVCHYLNAFEQGTLEVKEVILSGPNKVMPLSTDACIRLLATHVTLGGDPSFDILENFITVLADQLIKLTKSPFFKPKNLESMIGEGHDVRVRMFRALFEVALAFAARSVTTCKAIQSEALNEEQAKEVLKKKHLKTSATAGNMVDRVKGMIKWADNDSTVIVFHGSGSVTAVYRDLATVPKSVKDLFKSQAVAGQGLEDYHSMSQNDLQLRLERICSATAVNKERSPLGYALTPDNLLKMALIIQRMQAGIPVIVMGETGCGKTSLVQYLAATCQVPFYIFSFHAGITEEEIVKFISEKSEEAKRLQKTNKSVWVFLDEINTCDYLGTINEIICHRSLNGSSLPPNLVFVAACNPYRLRPAGRILTAGLGGKASKDEYSRLVYRVHPLPETMIDYVWDYGSLDPQDEKAYIGRMVEGVLQDKFKGLLTDLLTESQKFIRSAEMNEYCVSLRDVYRTVILVRWFEEILEKRTDLAEKKVPDTLKRYFNTSKKYSSSVRSIILALAHCYLSRLPTTKLRQSFYEMTTKIFKHHIAKFEAKAFEYIIRAEQEDFLLRMELPEGTARNAALRENVFIILVCILNRIPVFVVGKPGCSKSLSMQIIRSNLRGEDSKDPFLKTLPQLFVVSYQGSESSTSEGIQKVFEKAKKYKKGENVLPVVLLDEIGLAEVSKFNPLKVLHRLLEPGKGEFPDVAVVGISNWALDAAKMNRAIHLSRPEPDEQDLYETGLSLRSAQIEERAKRTRSGASYGDGSVDDDALKSLAEAYYQYQKNQKRKNFHGLRDYYSMVKCISLEADEDDKYSKIQQALQRNFGGLSSETSGIHKVFLKKLEEHHIVEDHKRHRVADLIRDNLNDKLARHLMIITNGDAAIGILDQTLADLNKEKITIFGSRFEEDLSADYNYRVLSRIILCMERDCVLILRDLENIYGSLYDMLNQNYTVVGGKKNCRIALGAFSNPMCQVHDGFRCIVLVDQSKVDYTDPPFLNRFEKQLLRFSDVLINEEERTICELEEWVEHISTVEGHETEFDATDMFAGLHEDTIPSLVIHQSESQELTRSEVVQRCKKALLHIATPDAVLRSLKSRLHGSNDEEVVRLHRDYFRAPLHRGLKCFLKQSLSESDEYDMNKGKMLLVMTHSNIHTDVARELQGFLVPQVEKLSSFKSEKQLSKRVKCFWTESDTTLLVLQCNPENDSPHILLAKAIIEEQREEYLRDIQNPSTAAVKHVCIIIHISRDKPANDNRLMHRWQFNFLSGWKQVLIDEIQAPAVPVVDLLELSIVETLQSDIFPFKKVLDSQLLWCFTRIKYPATIDLSKNEVAALRKLVTSSPLAVECFQELCCRWVKSREEEYNGQHESWQVFVACDRQALVNSSTVVKALERCVNNLIRQPLAKIIYFMENESLWPCLGGPEEILLTWRQLMLDERVLSLDAIPDAQGAESLVFRGTGLRLSYPFAAFFCRTLDSLSSVFVEQMRLQLDESSSNHDEEMAASVSERVTRAVSMAVEQKIPVLLECDYLRSHIGNYIDDVLDIKSNDVCPELSREDRVRLLQTKLFPNKDEIYGEVEIPVLLSRLHSAFWEYQDSAMLLLQFVSAAQNVHRINLCKTIDCFFGISEVSKSENETLEHVQILADAALDEMENKGATCVDHQEENDLDASSFATLLPVQESDVPLTPREKSENRPQEHDEGICIALQSTCQDDQDGALGISKDGSECTENENSRGQQSIGGETGSNSGERSGNEEDPVGEAEESQGQNLLEGAESEDLGDDVEEGDVDVEEEEEEPDTIECYLVRVFCKALVPTEALISEMDGVEKWEKATSEVLSLASKMQTEQPVFFFLKVCDDFAKMVLLPAPLKPGSLIAVGELGYLKQIEEEGYLDSVHCFESICDITENLRNEVNDESLTKFLYNFFARCIDANPDVPSMERILTIISQSGDDRLLKLAYPIVYRVLLSERDAFSSKNYGQILASPNELEDYPNLRKLSQVLVAWKDSEVNDQFIVMCCDLISEVAFKDLQVESVIASECPVLQNFHRAMEIFLDNHAREECGRFAVLCAIAYLRSFLGSFAHVIQRHSNCLSTDGEFALLIDDVSAALDADTTLESAKEQVRLFLLKELRDVFPMFTVKDICQQSTKMKCMKEFHWREDHPSAKLSLDPLLLHGGNTDVETALGNLAKENPVPMQTLLSSLNSSKERLRVAVALIKTFYLIRSIRNIKDTEDAMASMIEDQVKNANTPVPYKQFLFRVINKENFGSVELDITPESPVQKVQIAGMLTHLGAVLTSHFSEGTSIFMFLLVDPANLGGTSLISLPESAILGYHRYSNDDCIEFQRLGRTCCRNCRGFTAFRMQEGVQQGATCCPNCNLPLDAGDIVLDAQPSSEQVCENGYIFVDVQDLSHHMTCVRSLTPVEFRILHLLVHSTLFLGSAIGLLTKEKLTDFVCKDMTIMDPELFCIDHVHNDLAILCKLLCCPEEQIINLLHVVIKDVGPVLLKDFSVPPPRDINSRLRWEKEFASTVKPLLETFHMGGMKPLSPASDGDQDLEDQIEEVGQPCPEQDPNLPLQMLFRKMKSKSFEDFQCYYMRLPLETKQRHALLGLFMDYHDKLSVVRYLVALTAWVRIVDSLLSRRITRESAKEKMIADAVIRIEEQSAGITKRLSKENLERFFDDFRKAWEGVLPHAQFSENDAPPLLSVMNTVGYCLVESQDDGRYLCQILTFLANLQNEFLEKVVFVAASGKCSALDFLQKGESASYLASVHVQDARANEIIQYEWNDDFLMHSQHNTKYGHGTEIIYDLEKIEKEMAVKFLLGKTYLSTLGGLREFVFSKQLFHDCADILNQLQSAVPQEPLPDDVERGLLSQMEKSLENIQTLCVDMEIILCVLKRTGGKPDEHLVTYAENWVASSHHLSKELFPEPRDAIKLKHVVALYESCEDILSEPVAECAGKEYRQEISEEVKRRMNGSDVLQEEPYHLKVLLEAVIVALKRFLFRYLAMKPNKRQSLQKCMADASLWPLGVVGETPGCKYKLCKVQTQLFPDSLIVGNVHSVLVYYQDLLRKTTLTRRPSVRSAAGMTSYVTQTSAKQPSRTQRKGKRKGFGGGLS